MAGRREVLLAGLGALTLARLGRAEDGGAGWSVGPALPYAVQEIYPVAFAGRIVLAGGIVDGGRDGLAASDRTVIWEPDRSAWRDGPLLPAGRHHPGLVALPERVLAIGGFAADASGFWQMQRTVLSLDRELAAWTAGPDLPAPRAEFVAGWLGGQVVVAGGRAPAGAYNRDYGDHGDVAGTLLLDPARGRWREGAPAPSARNSAAGAVLDGRLHVVGGRQGGAFGIANVASHEVYDPEIDGWSRRAPMPQAQGGLAAAALGGRLYAFGGEYFGVSSGVFAEAWAYDPIADRWQALTPMPVPRHGLGAVALDGDIHVLGGATAAGANGRSDRHDLYRPA
jgi:hypothetical protein